MNPIAVDLFTGALRPFHSKAWNVQVDDGRAGPAAGAQPPPRAGLPAQPPLATSTRCCSPTCSPSTTSRATTCSAGTTCASGRSARSPSARGIVFIRRSFGDDEVYKLAVREYFGYLLAKRFNLEWYMEGGRSRTGKLRPPRYGLLAYVVEAVEQRPRRRRLPRAGVDHLRPAARGVGDGRRAGRGAEEGARAWRGSPATPAPRASRSGRPTSGSPSRSRCARRCAASRPDSWRSAEGRLRGLPPDQPGHAGHGDGAGHAGPARGARPGAHRWRRCGRCSTRCSTTWPSAGCRRRRSAPLATDTGLRRVLGALAAAEGRHGLHRRRGAGLRHRTRTSTSWPPSTATRSSTTSSTGRSPSWCCSREPEDRWDAAGVRAARPAQVRVLLPRPRRPPRPAHRRAGADGRRAGTTADGPRRARGRPVAPRPPGAALVRRRPARGGRAARRPRPAHRPSSRRSSSTSAPASGSRCSCRAGCTGRSRSRGSCSRSALQLAANRDLVDAGREELGTAPEELAAQLDGVVGRRAPASTSSRRESPHASPRAPPVGDWSKPADRRRRGGPRGPAVGAFFDFDGTADRRLLARPRSPATTCGRRTSTPPTLGELLLTGLRGVTREADFERVHRRSACGPGPAAARTSSPSSASACSCRASPARSTRRRGGWSRRTCGPGTPWCSPRRPPASRCEPAARAIGVEHVLVIAGGDRERHLHRPPRRARCSGGPARPTAVQAFAADHDVDLAGELRLLQRRRGRAVPADRRARRGRSTPAAGWRAAAAEHGWPIARFRSRGRAGLRDIARTAAASAGMLGGFGTGVGARGAERLPARRRRPRHRPRRRARHARWPGCGSTSAAPSTLAGPAGGVRVQPPEPARRAHPGQAAARRLHRRGQEGAGATTPASG